jgi:hypothetical protein
MMPAPTPKITLEEYRVVLGDEDDESTWSEITVRLRPMDSDMAFDLIGRHKEWPKPADNPYRLVLAQVFYALKRRGEYTGNFDQFRADALVCESTDDDEEVTPTEPAPTAG